MSYKIQGCNLIWFREQDFVAHRKSNVDNNNDSQSSQHYASGFQMHQICVCFVSDITSKLLRKLKRHLQTYLKKSA